MKSLPQKGSSLKREVQKDCLRKFVHRYTKDHIPNWVKSGKTPVQFESDIDWLEHTFFQTKKDGTLDERYCFCESNPTWPENPELRS